MSKYRIIKSVAANKDKPYFPQYWDQKQVYWASFRTMGMSGWSYYDLSFATLKEAKSYLRKQQQQDEINNTPAEVVWEEDDE